MKKLLYSFILFLSFSAKCQTYLFNELLTGEYESEFCVFNENMKVKGHLLISSSDSSDIEFTLHTKDCNTVRNYYCTPINLKGYKMNLIIDEPYEAIPDIGNFELVDGRIAFVISRLTGYDDVTDEEIRINSVFFKLEPINIEELHLLENDEPKEK